MKPIPAKRKATSRKRPVDREGIGQAQLFAWYAWAFPKHPLTHHIPNGGKRNKITAAKLKREGVKKGIPDINAPYPAGRYHGLYIEFKAARPHSAAVSADQKRCIAELISEGYRVEVCRGVEEAMAVFIEYFALRGIKPRAN